VRKCCGLCRWWVVGFVYTRVLLTSGRMLEGTVCNGAHDFRLEHEVAESRAVETHVLIL